MLWPDLPQFRPVNLGQASRIGGVSPADVTALTVHLEVAARQRRREREAAAAAGSGGGDAQPAVSS